VEKLTETYMNVVDVFGFEDTFSEVNRHITHMVIMDVHKSMMLDMVRQVHDSLTDIHPEHIPKFDEVINAEIYAFLSGKYAIEDEREQQTIRDHIAKYSKYNSYIFEHPEHDIFMNINLNEIRHLKSSNSRVIWTYDIFPITKEDVS
jgi:hypothetical protein